VTQHNNASAKLAFLVRGIDMKIFYTFFICGTKFCKFHRNVMGFQSYNFENMKMLRLKSDFHEFFLCLKYKRNYFLIKALDKVLIWLYNGGILEHVYRLNNLHNFIVTSFEMEKNLKVFSVDDLSFGFLVWLGSCGIAVIAFIIELNMKWILKVLQNISGLIVLVYILRQQP
jgi:hypothetical protein